jgi:hypothetical protein
MAPKTRAQAEAEAPENDRLKLRATRVVSSSAGQLGQRSFPQSLGIQRQGSFILVPTGKHDKNGEPKMKKERVNQSEDVLDGASASEEEREEAREQLARVSVTTLPVQRPRVPPLKKWDAIGQLVPYAAPAATL